MRDEPYMTEPPRMHLGPVLTVALVVLYLTLGRGLARPWSAVIAMLLGLAILSRGFEAMRTNHVEFVMPSGIRVEADRHRTPVRYWLLTATNWAFGSIIIAIGAGDALAYVLAR